MYGDSERLQSLTDYIAGDERIILAYLFGSQAREETGPLSDYDIALLIQGEMAFKARHRLAREIAELLRAERVDVVLLNTAPIELRYNVVYEGRLLYQRDNASQVEFEADTLSRYFDFLPVLRQQRREIIEGGGSNEAGVHRYREALGKAERVLAEIRAAEPKRA